MAKGCGLKGYFQGKSSHTLRATYPVLELVIQLLAVEKRRTGGILTNQHHHGGKYRVGLNRTMYAAH